MEALEGTRMKSVPAYYIDANGDLKVVVDGKIVANFKRGMLPCLATDILADLLKELQNAK